MVNNDTANQTTNGSTEGIWGTREKRPLREASPLRYVGINDVFRLGEFGVEGNAALLRRYEFIQRRLVYLEAGHIPSRTRYELKLALARHLYEDAEATTALRGRIPMLRQPEKVLDRIPDQRLALFMEELLHAATDEELLLGLYEVLKPALLSAYRWHIQATHQVADQPTIRILRQICMDLEGQIEWGREAIAEYVDSTGKRAQAAEFKERMHAYLEAAGGVSGLDKGAKPGSVHRWRSFTAFSVPRAVRRDERFPGTIHYRAGAPNFAENEIEEKFYWILRYRQEEIEVAELLGSIIWQQQTQPWEFTADVARHLWDEARHAMLGQLVLEFEGVDWMSYPQHTSIYDANIDRLSSDQYAYLWAIESMQMPKAAKRAEYEFIRDKTQHPLGTQMQDYDWADEVVHVHVGRELVPQLYDNNAEVAWQAAQQVLDEWFVYTEKAQEGYRSPLKSRRPGEASKSY